MQLLYHSTVHAKESEIERYCLPSCIRGAVYLTSKDTANVYILAKVALCISEPIPVCLIAYLYYSKGSPTEPVSFIWEKCLQS